VGLAYLTGYDLYDQMITVIFESVKSKINQCNPNLIGEINTK